VKDEVMAAATDDDSDHYSYDTATPDDSYSGSKFRLPKHNFSQPRPD